MKYEKKENYVAGNTKVDFWRDHINSHILNRYKKYLVGSGMDLGCNHGACTIIASENPNINHIVGIDINEKMIKLADERKTDKTSFKHGNILNIDEKSESMDFAICFHTIEHLYPEDLDTFISEVYRVLGFGGVFLISCPYDREYLTSHHVSFFNEDSLNSLLQKNHFVTIEIVKETLKPCLTGLFIKLCS